jgi:hypothetical protein
MSTTSRNWRCGLSTDAEGVGAFASVAWRGCQQAAAPVCFGISSGFPAHCGIPRGMDMFALELIKVLVAGQLDGSSC